jgi:hypothetical protein
MNKYTHSYRDLHPVDRSDLFYLAVALVVFLLCSVHP